MNSVHDIAKATIQVLDYTGDLVKKAEDQRIHLLEQMDIWSTQLAELSAMFQKLQGYYRTNSGERISPQDIDYRIVRIEKGSSVLETACGVFSERIKTE